MDPVVTDVILKMESSFEALLAPLEKEVAHLPSRVRSLLWILCSLPLMAERYAQLAEEPESPPARPLPEVMLRVDQANLAATLDRLGLSRAKPIVAFCPGAEYGPAKRWPARYFAELAAKGDVTLKGLSRPTPVSNVVGLKTGEAT